MKTRTVYILSYSLLLALFLTVPIWAGSYVLEILIIALWLGFLGSCWNIIGGYGGQLSIGHGTFVGIGAYTSSLLFNLYGITPWLGSFAGAILSAAVGLGIGFLCFRFKVRGIYFALITMAIAEIAKLWFEHMELVGSTGGLFLKSVHGPSGPAFFQFETKWPYYLIILGMLVAVLLICFLLERSKMGYYLKAVRGDEDAARCLGVSAFRCKCIAMCISSFLIAFGGTFYAQYRMYIKPDLLMGIHFSVELVIPTVIGGWGTVLGPVLGALLLIPLAEFSRMLTDIIRNTFHTTGLKGFQLIIYGLILIVVIRFMPLGIVGLWSGLRRKKASVKYAKD
jgi:branched-chain amino acid transport system permease protein